MGSCVLALYARSEGAPLRATKDVDCLSTLEPWIRQESILAKLSAERRLVPDLNAQFQYTIAGTDLVIDILSPEGTNIGGADKWLRLAAEHARE